jgi:hypothetical protein
MTFREILSLPGETVLVDKYGGSQAPVRDWYHILVSMFQSSPIECEQFCERFELGARAHDVAGQDVRA